MKEHIKKLIVVVAVLVLLLVFYPRRLSGMLFSADGELSCVTVYLNNQNGSGDSEEYSLTDDDLQRFLKAAENSYVFFNPIKKSFTNGNTISIFPEYSQKTSDTVPPTAFVLTANIITINDVQYRFYGNSFYSELENIIS